VLIGGSERHVEISNNTAGRNGGGIWQGNNSDLTLNGVVIENNHAVVDGGGAFLSTFEYSPILSDNAYQLSNPASIWLHTDNIYFRGNTAGAGAWQPPTNAAIFGVTNWGGTMTPRMQMPFGSISLSPEETNIWLEHGLNNYDINFRGSTRVDRNPDTPYEPPETDITINVDYDENVDVIMPRCVDNEDEDFECNDDDDRYIIGDDDRMNIVVTFPPGTDEDSITVNLPDDSWSYRIVEDEDGNVVVVITPPWWDVTFDAEVGGAVVPEDVLLSIRRRRSIVNLNRVGDVPTPTPDVHFEFSYWTSSDPAHRIAINVNGEEDAYRLEFTTAEIVNFLITQDTEFTAHFVRINRSVTFVAESGGSIDEPNLGITVGSGLTVADGSGPVPSVAPDANRSFTHWTSNDPNHPEIITDLETLESLLITQDTEFTAHFGMLGNPFRLTKTNEYLYIDMEHDNFARLDGARFTLHRYESGEWAYVETAYSSSNPDNLGLVIFEYLLTKDGVYRLEETLPPSGFRRPHGYWEVTWCEDSESFAIEARGTLSLIPAFRVVEHDDEVYLYVGNFRETVLPNSGGRGARVVTILGALSLFVAVLLYVNGKQANNSEVLKKKLS